MFDAEGAKRKMLRVVGLIERAVASVDGDNPIITVAFLHKAMADLVDASEMVHSNIIRAHVPDYREVCREAILFLPNERFYQGEQGETL